MNIVKYQDVILTSDDHSAEEVNFFNNNLKGKYAYAVDMLWVFPFDNLSYTEFVELSNGTISINNYTDCVDYGTYATFDDYIDIDATEKANSIDKFVYLNSYSTDSDITIAELKMFRTWLATQLLDVEGFVSEFVEDHTDFDETMINSMLTYYANEMSDGATKMLSLFAPGTIVGINPTNVTTCGCSSTSATLLAGSALNVCDPYSIYINEIYKYMVRCFSEIDFWNNDYLKDTIVIDFKNYIDNIIKVNLPLTTSTPVNYEDCTCLNTDSDLQARYQAMLSQLSTALGYIINGEVDGHKNFIYNSLVNWASYLYEKMRW